jgi:hypothetical protein
MRRREVIVGVVAGAAFGARAARAQATAPLLGMNLLFRAVLLLVLRTQFRRALVN